VRGGHTHLLNLHVYSKLPGSIPAQRDSLHFPPQTPCQLQTARIAQSLSGIHTTEIAASNTGWENLRFQRFLENPSIPLEWRKNWTSAEPAFHGFLPSYFPDRLSVRGVRGAHLVVCVFKRTPRRSRRGDIGWTAGLGLLKRRLTAPALLPDYLGDDRAVFYSDALPFEDHAMEEIVEFFPSCSSRPSW